jgi:serine/threonine protein kinase
MICLLHAATLSCQAHGDDVFVIGEEVDHYRILGKLGEGGMGVVYEAEDTRLSRTVALKVLSPGIIPDQEAKERFVREARAASALDHPSICTVHEISETPDDQLYIVMACYKGETLDKIIERGLLDTEKTVDYASQIALGLAATHRKGIVHRDLKPSNIFITDEGLVKILDFGLAKLIGDARSLEEDALAGTIAYMSPEQVRGEKTGTKSDIWSFGVVLYEMLTGGAPFGGGYKQAVLYSILNEEPKPLKDHRPEIPEHLCRIVERCLQKETDRRFRSFEEVLAELSPEKRFHRFFANLRDLPQQVSRLRRLVIGVLITIVLAAVALFLWREDSQRPNPMMIERIVLKGRIVDSTRAPVPAASVTLVAVHFQVFTREDGTFLGVVESRSLGEKLVLVISHPEHQTRIIDHIINSKEEDFGEIVLKK